MRFFPLEVPDGPPRPRQRFEAYQRRMRADFFDTHFASFDRQIMLVDVLGALYAGCATFEDTARVIQDLAKALHYGGNTLSRAFAAGVVRHTGHMLPSAFSRVTGAAAQRLTNRRIERVAFVATKADHVPALKRDNLLNLLRTCRPACRPRVSGWTATWRSRCSGRRRSTQPGRPASRTSTSTRCSMT